MDTTRRGLLRAGLALPVAASGLAVGAPAAAARPAVGEHERMLWPLTTTEPDWAAVARALGRAGKLLDRGRTYRVGFPRRDLSVRTGEVTIAPSLALGGYTAFARYRDGRVLLMGDLVVTEPELQALTDALQANGIAQTGIHKHLLAHSPQVWWAHVHALGDPVATACGVRAALDQTATPPATPPDTTPGGLDTSALDGIMGRAGAWDGGVYKYGFARAETITDQDRVLTPGLGTTTGMGFQPTGDGAAAINGDVVMIAGEVQPVIQALRAGGIDVVELHNHALTDNPRLFYLHFWANAGALDLARALRAAVDATNTAR